MSASAQRFQTIVARSRPHRIAVLTNIHDPNWQDSCIGIIEFLTKLWGGSQAVIIPTDGKTIAAEFWAVLSAHDPDIIYRYQTTGKDLRRLNPERFSSILEAQVNANLTSSGMTEEGLRTHFEQSLGESFLDDFSISEELSQQLILRLAAIHFEPIHTPDNKRQISIAYISRGASPSYPLTQVLDVIPKADSSKVVAEIVRDIENDKAPPDIWIAARIGANNPDYLSELGGVNVTPHFLKMSDYSESQLISFGIHPGITLKTPTPLSLSMTALAFYRSVRARRYQLPTVVLVGDSINEFCIYYALQSLQGRSLWLPKWFLETTGGYSSRLSKAVNAAVEIAKVEHSEQLAIASFTVSIEELQEVRTKIQTTTSRTSVSVEAMTAELVQSQLEYPSRCCTDGNFGDITTRMLVDNELPGWFDSPRPAKINPLNPQLHRWMVDITFEKHLLPRHPALGAFIVSGPNLSDARSGRDGISYSCPGMMVFGTDMDLNILRPSIRGRRL